jgi:hypothetical protein
LKETYAWLQGWFLWSNRHDLNIARNLTLYTSSRRLRLCMHSSKHLENGMRLKDFLLSIGFKMGKVDTTLFTKTIGNDLFVCQIYVDDIIFILINQDFSEEFGKMLTKEFEMFMIVKLLPWSSN